MYKLAKQVTNAFVNLSEGNLGYDNAPQALTLCQVDLCFKTLKVYATHMTADPPLGHCAQ